MIEQLRPGGEMTIRCCERPKITQSSVFQLYIFISPSEYQKCVGRIFSLKKGGKRFYIYHMKINESKNIK